MALYMVVAARARGRGSGRDSWDRIPRKLPQPKWPGRQNKTKTGTRAADNSGLLMCSIFYIYKHMPHLHAMASYEVVAAAAVATASKLHLTLFLPAQRHNSIIDHHLLT